MSRQRNSSRIAAALASFAITSLAVFTTWLWLGTPVQLPPVPLARQKLYCVSYAPYRNGQTPLVEGTTVEPRQIDEDLALLSNFTDCVRTYSVDNGLDTVLQSARRYGLKVLHGVWISNDTVKTRRQIETSIALTKAYPDVITGIVVGNEVLLRGEISAADLIGLIRQVKSRVAMPVTYADVWEFWLRYPDVQSAVDFITVHILPYWEDFPIPASRAAAHVGAIRARIASAFPGKDIVIGEFGWPSAGRMRQRARPSPSNQALAISETLALAQRENFRVNIIEAFNQPWKRALEGAVGGYWGIFNRASGAPKFSFAGGAISDHPNWLAQAVAGLLLAALTFAGAVAGGRKKGFSPSLWPRIAALAFLPAAMVGWIIETVPVESFSLGSWLRSLAFATTAAAAPIVCAAACAAGRPPPPFARLLAGNFERRDGLDWALGLTLMAAMLCSVDAALGLVFDPRYRDIPFVPLTAVAAPFLVLVFSTPRPKGSRALAETAAAAVLTLCAVYILVNETFANWQSVWFCGGLIGLAIVFALARDAPGSG